MTIDKYSNRRGHWCLGCLALDDPGRLAPNRPEKSEKTQKAW